MVRRFKGHKDRVTGVVISQDARWLLSSSMDGTVRVWDIPAACCLQVTLMPLRPLHGPSSTRLTCKQPTYGTCAGTAGVSCIFPGNQCKPYVLQLFVTWTAGSLGHMCDCRDRISHRGLLRTVCT